MGLGNGRRLHPWPEPALADPLSLWATAERSGDSLLLLYHLHWPAAVPLHGISGPPGGLRAPQRADGLWQHTCFEAFVGVRGEEAYWELNLAPSGDWNVYRLEGYRRDLQPEPSLLALPFCRRLGQEGDWSWLQLSLRAPLPAPLRCAQPLDIGLTAVLALPEGRLSYWALAHPCDQPDFHDRRGWILEV